MVTRRDFLRSGVAVGVAGGAGVTQTGVTLGQSTEPDEGTATDDGATESLVVDDFESGSWPGENALGEWTSADALENGGGSGELVDGAVRLEFEDAGWFMTNVQRDVGQYDRLELVARGDVDAANVQVEVGGAQDSLGNLTDDAVGSSFAPVGIELGTDGVGGSVDDVRLAFWRASGTLVIDEIRLVGDGSDQGDDVEPIADSTPTDPDGDGLYEDVNGNGRVDADDVVTFFEHSEDAAVTDHAEAYDFNDNGRIDFDDVATLFGEI